MDISIREVTLLDTLKTDDGEHVPPGTYPVTQICLRREKGIEEDFFFLDGFEGVCIGMMGLFLLRQEGKIIFSTNA